MIKKEITEMISRELPLVDINSDQLFAELDSLGVTMIMMMLSDKYKIMIDSNDVTPRNFKSVDSLAELVKIKMMDAI